MNSPYDTKPIITGSGRQIGEGIPEPDDFGQVTTGGGREVTYRKAGPVGIPEPEAGDMSLEPVPVDQPLKEEPKPAYETEVEPPTAFPMAKMPTAPLSDAEHEKEVGWWQNTGRGFLNRVGDDLLTNLGQFGNKVVDKVTTAIPGSEYTPMVAGARAAAGYLEEAGESIGGNDYRVRGDWETVENAWAKLRDGEVTLDAVTDAAAQTGEFMLETGVVSLPDMMAMVAAMPAYLASRVEELATERAENDNRDVATAEDYAIGGATATIVTAIDRMSFGFATKPLNKLLEQGFAPALKRIGKATAVEAGQEAVQEQLEYLGTGVGTETGVTLEEAKRRSAAGAVGGAGFGATVSTASNIANEFRSPDVEPTVGGDGPAPADGTEVSVQDDDYQPTPEEKAVVFEDFVTPPEEVAVDTAVDEIETDTEAAETTEAGEQEAEAKPVPTIEDNLRKAWKEAPQRVPAHAVDKAVTMGLHPNDVEFTGKDGAYKAGDVDVALNINKVGETDETIAAAMKAAGKKEEASGTTPASTEGEATDTEAAKPTTQDTAKGGGGSDRGVATEPSSGTDEAATAGEEAIGAEEEKPALTKKFSRKPYGVEAAEAGLTDADFEGIEANTQGVYTKASIEKAKVNKAKRDRGTVRSETQQVLDFIEEQLPKSDKYATEKTGRSRAGGLDTKATAVSSLVTLTDRLIKNSSAPQEVINRAVELAGKFRKLSGLTAEQMAGKGFTSVINAATLDPAIDELTELVTALDQNREADATKIGKVDANLVEKAEAAEAKAVEAAKPLTPQQIAEQKSDLAKKRKKIRDIEVGIRRSAKPNKTELLSETQKKLKEIAAAEAKLDAEANVLEKVVPTAKKRAVQKKGETAPVVGRDTQRQVKAETTKNVVEAKKIFSLLGVPEQVTTAAKKVADFPIDMNHYTLLVGLVRDLKRTENAAIKNKDAATEQQAKKEQRALAQVTKDIISSPDETRDLAHQRAAGELAKFNIHEDVINDVIDFAESSRVVSQKALLQAEETTETIREITVEESIAEQEAEQAADQQGSLQEQLEAAMEAGDWDRVAELQAAEVNADYNTADDLQPELESDTITLSDEFDANDASNTTFDTYSDSKRDRSVIGKILDLIPPRPTPYLRKLFKRQRQESIDLGGELLMDANTGGDQQIPANELLQRIVDGLPSDHPYNALARLLMGYQTDAIIEWSDELDAGVSGRHRVSYFGSQDSAEALHWQVELNKNMAPVEVVQTILHEMVHNHTTMRLRSDIPAAVALDNLREDVLAALDELGDPTLNTLELRNKLYGLTDVDEFVAEAFANPEFQHVLMGLRVKPDPTVSSSTKKTSAWQRLVGILKRMFGAEKYTAFDEVMRLAPEVFHDDTAYDQKVTISTMLKQRKSVDLDTESGPGEINRIVRSGDVVQTWTMQRNNIVKNAEQALGSKGRDFALSSYNLMQGNDPEALGDLKEGSERSVGNLVRRLTRDVKDQRQVSQVSDAISAFSLGLQTFDQIVRNHAHRFKTATGNALKDYEAVMRGKNRIAARWQNRGAAIDEKWAAIEKSSAKTNQRFSQFVQDVTMSEVHPDFPWDKQKHLFNAKERKAAEARWKSLNAQWVKLPKLERETFIETREYFTAQRKQQTAAAIQHLSNVYMPTDPEAAKLASDAIWKHKSVAKARASSAEVDGIFETAGQPFSDAIDRVLNESKIRGAYFPLRRFGDKVVAYKRNKTLGEFSTKKEADAAVASWKLEHPGNRIVNIETNDAGAYVTTVTEEGVEFFESSGDARKAIRQLAKEGWDVPAEPVEKAAWAERFDVGAAVLLQQAEKKFAVDDNQTDAVRERNESMQRALKTAFIELLAENSIRKSSLQRKNIRGASLNGRRVFAERVFAGSYALADLETMYDQQAKLQAMDDITRSGGVGSLRASQVVKELMLRERHNVNDQKSSRFNDWVGSLGFLGFLAGPSYPIINATQPYMVGLPWLGARYGLKANKALIQNASKFGPVVMKELIDSRAGLKRNPHQAIQNAINKMSKTGVAGGVEMLNAMRDAGIMDSTFIDAVSEAAKAQSWTVSQTGLFKFFASAPKIVEVMNRTVMATTAYQLEMEKSGNKEKAIEVAKDAILQTQFDYSDFNKPRYFKIPVLRPLLLFKMYPQGIYALLVSSLKQATAGTKEERRVGRNTLMGITASHTVMGGALGGIFMEPVRMLLSLAEMLYPFDDDDEENLPFWDKQRFDNNMRGLAVDLIGDEYWAELAMRGIPRAIGMDLSGRLGLHNLMFMGVADDGSQKGTIHKGIEQLGGAPLAAVLSWERSMGYFAKGDYARWAETAAPKFVRDALGAQRMNTRGLETFSGQVYMRPDEFDGFDYFVKMMGFSPAKTAELQEERWAQLSYDKRMMNRRTETRDRYMQTKDITVLTEWNAKHPDYAINAGDIIRKKWQQRKDELQSYKGYPVDFRKPSVRKQARF